MADLILDKKYLIHRLIALRDYRAQQFYDLRFIASNNNYIRALLRIVDHRLSYHFNQGALRFHRQSNKTYQHYDNEEMR